MFKTIINEPISPLTSNYVNNFTRPRYDLDYTLTCLGIALLKSRVENYRGFCGCCDNYYSMQETIGFVEQITNKRKEDHVLPGFFYIQMNYEPADVDMFKAKMMSMGLTELEQVEVYVQQAANIKYYYVFIQPETDTAFIISKSMAAEVYHISMAFLYALYPRLFKNEPLSRAEVALLKTLTNESANPFIAAMKKMLEPLKTDILKRELMSWFSGFRETKVQNASRAIQVIQNSVEANMNEYRNLMSQLEEAIIKYEGLKALKDNNSDQENEFADYIANNPMLHGVTYSDGYLKFMATTYLTNFDVMKFKSAVRNNDIYNSYSLNPDNPFSKESARRILLNALFNTDDPDLMVNMIGEIYLDINRQNMTVSRGDVISPGLENYITNPHYKYHGCPGTNRDQIVACLRQGDLMNAVECSIAGVGSVNIAETEYTFRRMVQEIFVSNKKIIHRRDGVDMTPAEALLWLIKKEGDKAA